MAGEHSSYRVQIELQVEGSIVQEGTHPGGGSLKMSDRRCNAAQKQRSFEYQMSAGDVIF
jgi:hypothetical protein